MKVGKRVLLIVLAVLVMGINVFVFYYNLDSPDLIQTIIAGMSVIVTMILGVTTYIQTRTQIRLDR